MTHVQGLEHVGVVVDDLEAAAQFFVNLGLSREAEASSIQGEWVDNVTGLKGARSDVVFVRTVDGSGTLELVKFHAPADEQGPQPLAANRLGIRHIAFRVDDLDGLLDTLRSRGIDTVGGVEDYGPFFRLCYVRGPEGIIVELAERTGSAETLLATLQTS
jgi:catechol 2,3-dioxygenase-like lactoylglutathione lyase family enzyme